ncbi:hypothetical protein GGX14DRAFT_388770 [Mycena pura]|uniref:Protein kinase domain-containing protein n=1 Tax=Mycena pura TaxID=153505 RepID=A0AAD6VST9_9AGAR|nr:hypothetical protein GGX14DRAFT_388770 [Mycena pura]
MHGSTSFVLDADPQVLGSGAAVNITYSRNTDVLECKENSALVPLSSLRCTHALDSTTHMFLVTLGLSETTFVLKTPQDEDSLVNEAVLMSRLPEADFVLHPTHVVTDDVGLLRGVLNVYHPASSLCSMFDSLHPDATRPVLASAGGEASPVGPLVCEAHVGNGRWGCARLAAHADALLGGLQDRQRCALHCRLINYCPGGSTTIWAPPESGPVHWRPSAKGDVFALGLALWAIAGEVGSFEREKQDASLLLPWGPHTPLWFQDLVHDCLEHKPDRRPFAHEIYNVLTLHNDSQPESASAKNCGVGEICSARYRALPPGQRQSIPHRAFT